MSVISQGRTDGEEQGQGSEVTEEVHGDDTEVAAEEVAGGDEQEENAEQSGKRQLWVESMMPL